MKPARSCGAVVLLAAATHVIAAEKPAGPLPQLGKANVKAVVAAMTLEEKAALVVGEGGSFGPPPPSGVIGTTQRLVPGAAGTVPR